MKKKYKKILAALIVVICLAVFGISLFKPVTAKMEVVRYGNLEKSFTVQAELTPVHSMISVSYTHLVDERTVEHVSSYYSRYSRSC